MNNFMIGLKRFFKNKNVVTIIAILIMLVVLYIGYSYSIKSKTNPLSIPVAVNKINPKTQIKASDVTYKQVASSMVGEGVIRSSANIIGKYTNVNVTVPKDSVFYTDWIVSADKLPGNWIEQLDHDKGELGYYMSVNIASTLGNSVLPDTYIDIYMKAKDENGSIMFGKLMKNIKVLVVHDSNGKNIFDDSSDVGTPAKIGFAVSQDYYMLLKKAEYLNIDLVIAPRGSTVPSEDYVIVTSATLRDYIDAQTITVEEDVIVKEVEDNTTDNTTNNQTNNTNTTIDKKNTSGTNNG